MRLTISGETNHGVEIQGEGRSFVQHKPRRCVRCALWLRVARTTAVPPQLPLLRSIRWPRWRALCFAGSSTGGGSQNGAGTIDVHHHYFPPAAQEATFKLLTGVFGDVPERIRNWSPARAVEELNRNGVVKAIISTSSRPRIDNLTPEEVREQARASNEYGARMVQDYPKRFAQFGFLPTPDVEATLQEIEYVFDVLKAPGRRHSANSARIFDI
jgi:Amidohydrolase